MRFFIPRYKFGEITKRWGDANFKREFDKILDDWLKQFSSKEIPTLLELLKNFYYYTEQAINQKVVELHQKFLSLNGDNIQDVLFAKLPKEYGVANSDIFFGAYWFNNEIKGYCSPDVVREYLEVNVVPKKLVLIDDYMGSGETIETELRRMLLVAPELQNSRIYLLLLHTTDIGLERITNFASEFELDLTICYLDKSPKAFKEDYIFPKLEARIQQEKYVALSERKGVGKGAVLGYKDVQSLVAFNKTTPNDTLGLFWHSAENFVSLFKQNKVPRNTSISQLKGVARKNAHRAMVLFDIDSKQYNKFIVYCILNGEKFSIEKACEDFGVTPEVLLERLRYIESHGYIKVENGKIAPTEDTKCKLIKSKIRKWESIENELENENKIPLRTVSYIPRDFEKSFSGYKK